jgi:hypothetical protein
MEVNKAHAENPHRTFYPGILVGKDALMKNDAFPRRRATIGPIILRRQDTF